MGPPFLEAMKRLRKHKLAATGAVIIVLLCLIALFAPLIAPHDPDKLNLAHRLLPPGDGYLLGTDNLGRCLFSRLVFGTRITLQVGFIVVGITTTVGVVLGAIAGYRGGIVDEIIMRCVDVLLAFPGIRHW